MQFKKAKHSATEFSSTAILKMKALSPFLGKFLSAPILTAWSLHQSVQRDLPSA